MGPPEQYIQLLDASNGLRVAVVKVGFGQVSINGDLGYPEELTNSRVMLPQLLPTDTVISAHASSELKLTLPWPAEVFGALDVTSREFGDQCEFWIDDHWIGDLRTSCDTTPAIRLPLGDYRLRATGIPHINGKHSLWVVRRIPEVPRLGLATIGCYARKDVKDVLKWLHRTAARQGILLNVFGVNTALQSFYSAKILRLAEWFKRVPNEYLAFMDGRDTFIQGDEPEIIQKVDELGGMVIGTERCCWPVASWSDKFDPAIDQRFPQAGMFAGTRQKVLDSLAGLIRLRSDMLSGNVPDWIKAEVDRAHDDDQALWQAAVRIGRVPAVPDYLSSLLINTTCLGTRLTGDADIHVVDGRLVTRWGTSAPLVHFPGIGAQHMEQWIGAMGICRDIKKPSV